MGHCPWRSKPGPRPPTHMARSPQGSAKKTSSRPWQRSPQAVDLQGKSEPKQERAVATAERILSTAEELLAEAGVERLSTNLICERAGFTPPALYRYLPNKYAVGRERGERLMRDQNRLLEAWATPQTMALRPTRSRRACCSCSPTPWPCTWSACRRARPCACARPDRPHRRPRSRRGASTLARRTRAHRPGRDRARLCRNGRAQAGLPPCWTIVQGRPRFRQDPGRPMVHAPPTLLRSPP